MNRSILIEIINDQKQLKWTGKISRDKINKVPVGDEIDIISGVRRCGKSTLLREIRYNNAEQDYYIDFDDERLIHFTVDDFQLLYEIFIEKFGEQHTFYFDEIQNIYGWERFVRRLHDYGNKIYITGSNARMLSKELGTHLTGRYIQLELFPFSFNEYLKLKKFHVDGNIIYSTDGKAKIKELFFKYFIEGGFPEYLKTRNKDYLKSLYESILYRDILTRNKLTKEKELKELVYHVASNVAKPVSYNSLTSIIGVKNATTVKEYFGYLENAYLTFLVSAYHVSVKKQLHNPKKVYFIDNALSNQLGFHFSEDRGRLLENLVFIELKRQGKEIFYHNQKQECDFVIKTGNKITEAIQVTLSLDNKKTKNREINGLIDALEFYQLDKGIILTEDEEDKLVLNNYTIDIIPVWKWLLE